MRGVAAIIVVSTALAAVLLVTSWREDPQGSELLDALTSKTSHLEALSKHAKGKLNAAKLPPKPKVAFGGKVGNDDVSQGILSSAKAKFLAHKKLVAKQAVVAAAKAKAAATKAAAAAANKSPDSVDGFRLDARARKKFKQTKAEHALRKKANKSAAQTIESEIQSHKLTTKGIIAAVKAAEANQIKELNQGLKEQTDDLIVAKIKQLQHTGAKANSKILDNALTKVERSELNAKKAVQAPPAASSGGSWQSKGPAAAWGGQAAHASRGRSHPASVQSQNGAIMHATGGSKGGNPEGMLSSYDQQILSGGVASLDETSPPAEHYTPPTHANMLSQEPMQQQQGGGGVPVPAGVPAAAAGGVPAAAAVWLPPAAAAGALRAAAAAAVWLPPAGVPAAVWVPPAAAAGAVRAAAAAALRVSPAGVPAALPAGAAPADVPAAPAGVWAGVWAVPSAAAAGVCAPVPPAVRSAALWPAASADVSAAPAGGAPAAAC